MDFRKRIATASMVASLALGLVSCAKGRGEPGWVHPEWTDKTGFVKFDDHATKIWQSSTLALFVDKARVARQLTDGKKLVMVSYRDDHPDRRLVEESPHAIALTAEGDARFALLALREQEHIDDLAARMHRHVPGFLPCGRVQRLYLTQNYEVNITTPPVLPEMVKFDAVAALVDEPVTSNIATSITTLEDLGTRYHNSTQGAVATTTVEQMFNAAGSGIEGFSVKTIDHSDILSTEQQSVVATIPGKLNVDITVVVGGHLDSINSNDNTDAPGADDDASGVAVMTEMIRSIAATGATFDYNIEFQAYAAEEVGLEGSKHIARTYAEEGKAVSAMFQLDMSAYSSEADSKTIWLVSNNTHRNLRRSLKHLMHTYIDADFQDGTLSGGTSDHEAWTAFGFPAVFPFENPSSYNFSLHTPDDTSETINNLELSTRFARLGLAFVSHYAGYTGASDEAATKTTAFVANLDADLPIAITSAGDDSWNVAVSVDNPAVTTVLVCRAEEKGSRRCGDALVEAKQDSELGDRQIWVTESGMTLTDTDRLVVFGYDSTDKAIAQRTVKLTRK